MAAVASRARGTTIIRDAAELREKESDRIVTTLKMLRALGVKANEPTVSSSTVNRMPFFGPRAWTRTAITGLPCRPQYSCSPPMVRQSFTTSPTSTFTKLLGELGAEIEEIYKGTHTYF